MPLVSVLLPVYNDSKTVVQSIRSILGQTFRDFELVIVDDGSTDNTPQIVGSFEDPRIHLIANERNLGLAPTLNRAIGVASGDYLARQDADDIALPHRLEKQVVFLRSHPDVAMVGSRAIVIDEQGLEKGLWDYPPIDDIDIKWNLLFRNPFIHSSVMMRRVVLDRTGLYTEDPVIFRAFVEDYDLWSRINEVAKSANFEEPLLKYRVSATSATSRTFAEQLRQARLISQRNICRLLRWDRIDVACWQGLERFLYHPVRQELDLTSAEVNCTLNFLTTIHETFCSKYGLAKREAAAHRLRVFWPWGKHALALSYRRNGRRDAACRFSLFAGGAKLVAKALRPA
jgi:glycosyltransferase involved in cell wall biosynthesis